MAASSLAVLILDKGLLLVFIAELSLSVFFFFFFSLSCSLCLVSFCSKARIGAGWWYISSSRTAFKTGHHKKQPTDDFQANNCFIYATEPLICKTYIRESVAQIKQLLVHTSSVCVVVLHPVLKAVREVEVFVLFPMFLPCLSRNLRPFNSLDVSFDGSQVPPMPRI